MFDESRVTYEIEVYAEDVEVRGNAMCSGDDDFDRQVEDEIIARLDDGDVWAWALVRVVARYDGIDEIEGEDFLGGCNYADEDDFKQPGGYYDDMKDEARSRLRAAYDDYVDLNGYDDEIDPYDDDPCNEVLDLCSWCNILAAEDVKGATEDYVFGAVEFGNGRRVEVDGPISWALPILRAAHRS